MTAVTNADTNPLITQLREEFRARFEAIAKDLAANMMEEAMESLLTDVRNHKEDRALDAVVMSMKKSKPADLKGLPSSTEITRWVADSAARRVPKFVIELTGLDTKHAIVEKYGEGATFEKGRPAPSSKK